VTTVTPPKEEFVPVRVGTLRPGDILDFDIFVLVAGRKIRHTVEKDVLDRERFAVLKEKNVKKIWIKSVSEPKYLAYLDRGLSKLTSNDAPVEARAEVAQATLTSLAGDPALVETKASFDLAADRVAKVNAFLVSEKNMARTFLKSAGISQDTAMHSAAVLTMAVSLGTKMGITDQKILTNIGLAALLHDVARGDETELKSHVEGAEFLLKGREFVPPAVVNLVLNHEEVVDASGPRGLRLETLPLEQRVLNIANAFDAFCRAQNLSPLDAGKTFFVDKLGVFPLDLMTALSEIVNTK
jgi:HD-GYP domain-containing protein (c-di-GMP phosphodiesterase class II)